MGLPKMPVRCCLHPQQEMLPLRQRTKLAKLTRMKIYKFLAVSLNPPHPFKSVGDLERAAYR